MNSDKIKIVLDARMINHSGIGTYIKCVIKALLNDYDLTLIIDEQRIIDQTWQNKVKIVRCTEINGVPSLILKICACVLPATRTSTTP